eukprot:229898-Rhodomonas_salina.1
MSSQGSDRPDNKLPLNKYLALKVQPWGCVAMLVPCDDRTRISWVVPGRERRARAHAPRQVPSASCVLAHLLCSPTSPTRSHIFRTLPTQLAQQCSTIPRLLTRRGRGGAGGMRRRRWWRLTATRGTMARGGARSCFRPHSSARCEGVAREGKE